MARRIGESAARGVQEGATAAPCLLFFDTIDAMRRKPAPISPARFHAFGPVRRRPAGITPFTSRRCRFPAAAGWASMLHTSAPTDRRRLSAQSHRSCEEQQARRRPSRLLEHLAQALLRFAEPSRVQLRAVDGDEAGLFSRQRPDDRRLARCPTVPTSSRPRGGVRPTLAVDLVVHVRMLTTASNQAFDLSRPPIEAKVDVLFSMRTRASRSARLLSSRSRNRCGVTCSDDRRRNHRPIRRWCRTPRPARKRRSAIMRLPGTALRDPHRRTRGECSRFRQMDIGPRRHRAPLWIFRICRRAWCSGRRCRFPERIPRTAERGRGLRNVWWRDDDTWPRETKPSIRPEAARRRAFDFARDVGALGDHHFVDEENRRALGSAASSNTSRRASLSP